MPVDPVSGENPIFWFADGHFLAVSSQVRERERERTIILLKSVLIRALISFMRTPPS